MGFQIRGDFKYWLMQMFLPTKQSITFKVRSVKRLNFKLRTLTFLNWLLTNLKLLKISFFWKNKWCRKQCAELMCTIS